jgi:hypothetical protein
MTSTAMADRPPGGRLLGVTSATGNAPYWTSYRSNIIVLQTPVTRWKLHFVPTSHYTASARQLTAVPQYFTAGKNSAYGNAGVCVLNTTYVERTRLTLNWTALFRVKAGVQLANDSKNVARTRISIALSIINHQLPQGKRSFYDVPLFSETISNV